MKKQHSILNVTNLSVDFHTREGITNAVKAISFELNSSEILGIVGESGSGKSVCCYSLLGLIPTPPGKIKSGTAIFEEKNLLALSENELRRIRGNKISMIFQDPMTSLNPYMSVGNQLIEAYTLHVNNNKIMARKKSIELLEEVGLVNAEKQLNAYPHEFSGGMRQRVMIAMALISEPTLLIADEPTTALDVTIQAQIIELIKRIQASLNLAVIFISHDLSVLSLIADRILVMENGKIVEQGETQKVFAEPSHPYTRKLIAAVPKGTKAIDKICQKKTTPLLIAKNITKRFPITQTGWKPYQTDHFTAVKNVSLTIHNGEIVGLVGESGSGKSTLGRSLIRLTDCNATELNINGRELQSLSSAELRLARKDFQIIFQDPYASLNPRYTVYDTLAEPLLHHGIATKKNILSKIYTLLDDVGLERHHMRKYPHEFSGGQRQRIAIARALAVQPKFIIADEPVSALDVTIQAQILELILQLTRKHGLTLLFISHDLAVVRYLCDRVIVMKTGEIVEEGLAESIFCNPQHPYTHQLLASLPTQV
ncbi:ABC transporter ATP-binding protein [Teredinibacter purpureus]|uniref:ABC transporter ATP-binding protein n=1 Tax=Teredinibacter purpureus TaxID=2731756 RepID=UPI0005F7EAC0|nr:dipeptide ABC transporter ATP-binding protein [Teredinibacter purpureus]